MLVNVQLEWTQYVSYPNPGNLCMSTIELLGNNSLLPDHECLQEHGSEVVGQLEGQRDLGLLRLPVTVSCSSGSSRGVGLRPTQAVVAPGHLNSAGP